MNNNFSKLSSPSLSPRQESEGDRLFYKCEFCQFTSEQDFLDLHLRSKHKNRVTCGHCARRFEFASKLKEHHDLAHKDLPVKYSQETLPFIKKEPLDPDATPSKASSAKSISRVASPAKSNPRAAASPAKKSQSFAPKSPRKLTLGLTGLFVIVDGKNGEPSTKVSLSAFQRMHDINPEVVLKRCDDVLL